MTPTGNAVRKRKPASERREEVVRAVLRILGDGGLSTLSTSRLAEEIGLSSGALFRHFASLDEVLRATARHAARRIGATFPGEELPPVERLLGLAGNRIRLLGSDPGIAWLLRSDEAFRVLPRDAVTELRGLVTRSHRYVLDALRDGAADGSIRGDIAPELLAVPLLGTIHAALGLPGVHRASGTPGPRLDDLLETLRRLLEPPGAGRRPDPARRERGTAPSRKPRRRKP